MNQLLFLHTVLKDLFSPLCHSLSSLEAMEYLFFRYGWNVSLDEVAFEKINQQLNIGIPLQEFLSQADALERALVNSESGTPEASQIVSLAQASEQLFKALANLSLSNVEGLLEPLNLATFWSDIADQLMDDLLENYLRVYHPVLYSCLHLFGVIRYESEEPSESYRRPYTRTVIDWDQAIDAIKNPLAALVCTYHWADPARGFEHQRLFATLHEILRAVGVSANLVSPDHERLSGIPSTTGYCIARDENALRIQFLCALSQLDLMAYEVGMEILPARRTAETAASGLLLVPVLRGGLGSEVPAGPDFTLRWTAGAGAESLFGAAIFPEKVDWISGGVTSGASIVFTSRFGIPRYVVGNSQTARIELSGVSVVLSLEGGANSPEIKLNMRTYGSGGNPGCKLVIPLDESDSFIQETLNKSFIELSFDVEVNWSNKTGLRFNGASTLDIRLPVRIELGTLTLEDARLTITESKKKTSRSSLELRAGTNILGKFGPVDFVVNQIGFSCQATPYSRQELLNLPPGTGPIFGSFDLDLVFAPPKGIGLSISGGGFKGGGVLDYDEANQRYAGFMELEYQDRITLKAIGLITTGRSNGSPSYSLLVVITSEFTPIQLGLGFSLSGVGGLLALNRTANVERLRTGIRDKTLDSILFPQDVIGNADRIISDLSQVFPLEEERFIFGPMARIEWGTPPLLIIDLGLFIEIPDPVRVLILGVVTAELPRSNEAVLHLRVNFLGVIDFGAETFAFDASLYDSKLLGYPLSGDMVVRMNWGAEPNFLLSVGGFHPAYQPPPLNLPSLRRLSMQLISESDLRLGLQTYFAVTSNTVQFGAKVELYAGADAFSVYGFLSIDVLFQFSPFCFVASVAAMLALRAGSSTIASVALDFTLEGPTPWHVRGYAKLKVCWFLTIKVPFDKTFGETRETTLEDVPVLPLLEKAFADKTNWVSHLPNYRHMLVTLRTPDKNESGVSEESLIFIPCGSLSIQQNVVPLKVDIQRFSSQRPADGNRFAIEQVLVSKVGASEPAAALLTEDVNGLFAPAQFFEMSDAQKLAGKSFEQYPNGVQVADSRSLQSDYAVLREVEYELRYVDSQGDQPSGPKNHKPEAVSFDQRAVLGAIAKSPLSFARNCKSPFAPAEVRFGHESYGVANVSDLRLARLGAMAGSRVEASEMMQAMIAEDPSLTGQIQVVPSFEVNLL